MRCHSYTLLQKVEKNTNYSGLKLLVYSWCIWKKKTCLKCTQYITRYILAWWFVTICLLRLISVFKPISADTWLKKTAVSFNLLWLNNVDNTETKHWTLFWTHSSLEGNWNCFFWNSSRFWYYLVQGHSTLPFISVIGIKCKGKV